MTVILMLLLLIKFLSVVIVLVFFFFFFFFLKSPSPGKLDCGLKESLPFVEQFFPYLGSRVRK